MYRVATFIVIFGFVFAATAEERPSERPATYLIRLSVREAAAAPEGREKIVAEPNIITVANRPAVFHVGGQAQVADETIRDGTLLKVTVKKLDGGKVRVSGMLEVSNIVNPPSAEVLEREAKECYFSRTVKLAEKVCLKTRSAAEGRWTVELTCHQVDSLQQEPPPDAAR